MLEGRRWAITVVATLVGAASCKDEKPASPVTPSATASAARTPAPAPCASAPSAERDEAPHEAGAPLKEGELADVGPAAPATASAHGVVMVTKDDELVVAKLDATGKLQPVKEKSDRFAVGRGPAVAGDHAYFTSKSRLVRRRVGGGPLEELADDARSGTRVSAVLATDKRAAVAYVGRPVQSDGGLVARLWVDGAGSALLTPEGSAANSVSVVANDDEVVVISLEGRTGMTPVHARVVELKKPLAPRADVVVWVAGPAQPLTEVAAATGAAGDVWAFIPMERDVTHFGMAQLRIGSEPKMGVPIRWRAYENGLDPAPVATAQACGGAMVLYAKPSSDKPKAPQQLELASLGGAGLTAGQVVARSSAFANVSLAAVTGGVLVAWVADFRTWAKRIACPSPPGAKVR